MKKYDNGISTAIQPKRTCRMSGNRIAVRTLNLDCEFQEIAGQLSEIGDEFCG